MQPGKKKEGIDFTTIPAGRQRRMLGWSWVLQLWKAECVDSLLIVTWFLIRFWACGFIWPYLSFQEQPHLPSAISHLYFICFYGNQVTNEEMMGIFLFFLYTSKLQILSRNEQISELDYFDTCRQKHYRKETWRSLQPIRISIIVYEIWQITML